MSVADPYSNADSRMVDAWTAVWKARFLAFNSEKRSSRWKGLSWARSKDMGTLREREGGHAA